MSLAYLGQEGRENISNTSLGEGICSPQPKIDTKKWPKVNSTPNVLTILLSSGSVYSDTLCKTFICLFSDDWSKDTDN